MRLWSLHPSYLDTAGLVACWREALLAQKVLAGETRGYKQHPQLERFKKQMFPMEAIGAYLHTLWLEALSRGYRFDVRKILYPQGRSAMAVTDGQLAYEFAWLSIKIRTRAPHWENRLQSVKQPQPNPVFQLISGDVEEWERSVKTKT